MPELILLAQVFSTLSMVGLIWFVQIVHYPLFESVGCERFADYERYHQQRTTMVVAPLMLLEVLTAILLIFWRPEGVADWLTWAGVGLLAAIWLSTFFWQVPLHERLAVAFAPTAHRRLVQSNWLRTAAWTFRGMLVSAMCWQVMSSPR